MIFSCTADIQAIVSFHIESIVLLSKLADDHIELEIDPLELEEVVNCAPPVHATSQSKTVKNIRTGE